MSVIPLDVPKRQVKWLDKIIDISRLLLETHQGPHSRRHQHHRELEGPKDPALLERAPARLPAARTAGIPRLKAKDHKCTWQVTPCPAHGSEHRHFPGKRAPHFSPPALLLSPGGRGGWATNFERELYFQVNQEPGFHNHVVFDEPPKEIPGHPGMWTRPETCSEGGVAARKGALSLGAQ